MRDAPQLAKELATLDTLSDGRLIVGVGVGDIEDISEYENLGKGDRFKVRGRYLDESIALWRHLWGGRTEPFIGQSLPTRACSITFTRWRARLKSSAKISSSTVPAWRTHGAAKFPDA
jgi:alkanesulfonate monooxygenase SsuD/methylene tetrahydromethanopterin reductase-like flavin-dependent oxidoreductase (luciferase family)